MAQQNNEFEKWYESEYGDKFNIQDENNAAMLLHKAGLIKAWQAAKADSERDITKLEASNELLHDALESNKISEKELLSYREHINVLREALEIARDYQFDAVNQFHNDFAGYKDEKHEQYDYDLKLVENALASTPAQSLQEHDNEVIERCAKVAMDWDITGIAIADAIRALKGE